MSTTVLRRATALCVTAVTLQCSWLITAMASVEPVVAPERKLQLLLNYLKPTAAQASARIQSLTGDVELAIGAAIFFALSFATYVLFASALGQNSSSKGVNTRGSTPARRRSWVVTFCCSAIVSLCGFYFALKIMTHGATPWPYTVEDATLAHALCIFALVYCLIDLLFGAFFYGGEFTPLGFSSHLFYVVVAGYSMSSQNEVLLALSGLEALPTCIKSLYEVLGDSRPRLPIGIAGFVFRLMWHTYLTYVATNEGNRLIFFGSTFLLLQHITWFRVWFFSRISNVRKQEDAIRSNKGKTQESATTKAAVASTTAATAQETKGNKENKDLKDANNAAKTGSKLALETETHMYIVSFLTVLQVAMHGSMVLNEIRQSLLPQADWTARWNDTFRLFIGLSAHFFAFVLVTSRLCSIIQDIYTEHFIMNTIGKRTIIYNISWEDPRVERELLNIGKDDVILTISSAGCNVLDYLCESPKCILACDFNPAQLAVLELKLACIKKLPYEDYFLLWAESNFEVFQKYYKSHLRDTLCDATRDFWDQPTNQHLIRDNFMFAGTSGLGARLVNPMVRWLGLDRYMAERKEYPPASICLALFRTILAAQWVWAWLAPLGGVPEAQLDLVKRYPHVFAERLEEVAGRRMWRKDNYFYHAYVVGKWTKDCCPRYLKKEHFATLRRCADRVILHHGPISEAAKLRDDITVASLLDSMDWMPDTMIANQFAALVPQMDTEKGHIFWRCFGLDVHSPVLAALKPEHVPDVDGSERVGWYLSQWVAPVPTNVDFSNLDIVDGGGRPVQPNTLYEDVKIMVTMGIHGCRKEKDVKAFYKSQSNNYDGFRESLLPGRDTLMKYCIPWETNPKIWLSVGCGTARDIEYVITNIKRCNTKVFLLDLSPELLSMAQKRVSELGLDKQVTCVEADIIQAYDTNTGKAKGILADQLPPLGTVDVVTCSYCLTMIPPWKKAMESMIACLKPGGVMAMVDFTVRSDCPNHWTQCLYKWWFSNDGVFFNVEHTEFARNHPKLETFWFKESESRVPYTLFYATHYTWAAKKM